MIYSKDLHCSKHINHCWTHLECIQGAIRIVEIHWKSTNKKKKINYMKKKNV